MCSWLFVYVDDVLVLILADGDQEAWDSAAALLMLLLVMGLPVSWTKLDFGFETGWIGHMVNVDRFFLRPADRKLAAASDF